MIGTHVDGDVKYAFVARRLCRMETTWQRQPGTAGLKPFGAATSDYHEITRRRCDLCPGWSGSFNYRNEHKVYVCRCRLCAHNFTIGEWAASDRAVIFIEYVEDRLASQVALRKDSTQFDGLVEVIRIARDFMDLGATEDAKHTLDDKLSRLQADGLIEAD